MMQNNIKVIRIKKEELKDLIIRYSFYDTDYGQALIASTDKGICYIGFSDRERMLSSMHKTYPNAVYEEKEDPIHQTALHYINHGDGDYMPLHIKGTDFQLDVWKALIDVPLGELSTYMAIAKGINNPKSIRAVGTAVGSNPVSYIIPCHRIIRTDGGIGGYGWGLDVKRVMLQREKELIK